MFGYSKQAFCQYEKALPHKTISVGLGSCLIAIIKTG